MSDEGDRRSGYTTLPEIPAELQERFIEVLRVLSGYETVTGAAKNLGISRVQMQTVVHRFIKGAILEMSGRRSGPRPKSPRERELEEKVKRLEKQLRAAEEHSAMLERFVEVTGQLLRGGPSRRRGKRSPSSPSTSTTASETKPEPEPERARDPNPTRSREMKLALFAAMKVAGIAASVSAKLLGIDASTLRRWRTAAAPEPRHQRDVSAEAAARIEERVRATRGLIGAAALARAMQDVSRRQAARVKSAALTKMERERRAESEPVEVVEPGIVRGFDAMHLATHDGTRYLLVAADASVPYRTSLTLVERYDGPAVRDAIVRDLDEHGAPLVWRMDRASAHRVPDVQRLLAERGVLVLHGPAHRPSFYGQLERQNREHRVMLQALGERPHVDAIARELEPMRRALNELWPRRSLGWQSPAEVWTRRAIPIEDRAALLREVQRRAARIAARAGDADAEWAWRIAIEEALIERGYLRVTTGAALNGFQC